MTGLQHHTPRHHANDMAVGGLWVSTALPSLVYIELWVLDLGRSSDETLMAVLALTLVLLVASSLLTIIGAVPYIIRERWSLLTLAALGLVWGVAILSIATGAGIWMTLSAAVFIAVASRAGYFNALAAETPPNLCALCRYELTGLPAGVPCPECGAADHFADSQP